MMRKKVKLRPRDEVVLAERIGDMVRTVYASGRVSLKKKKQFLLGV